MGLSFWCSALHGKDNAISDVERGDGAFVSFIFPWFQYLLTIRNSSSPPFILSSICMRSGSHTQLANNCMSRPLFVSFLFLGNGAFPEYCILPFPLYMESTLYFSFLDGVFYLVTTGWMLRAAHLRIISINQGTPFDIEQRFRVFSRIMFGSSSFMCLQSYF